MAEAVESGSYTPEAIARKIKIAEQLWAGNKQPIQHWTQGVNRLAEDALGGYMLNRAEKMEREGQNAAAGARFSMLTGQPMPAEGNIAPPQNGMQRVASFLGLGGSPTPDAAAPPSAPPSPVPQGAPPADLPAPPQVPASGAGAMPRGIRNNNPLNIEAGNFTQGQPGFGGSDGRFAKFGDMNQGIAAADKLLQTYSTKHGLNTVAGVINRWAPPSDGNNVSAYANAVSQKLGVDPNAPLNMQDPNVRRQLIMAMGQHENGQPIPVGGGGAPMALQPPAGPPGMPPGMPGAPPDQQFAPSPTDIPGVPTAPTGPGAGGSMPSIGGAPGMAGVAAAMGPGGAPPAAPAPPPGPGGAPAVAAAMGTPPGAAAAPNDPKAKIAQMLQSKNPYIRKQGMAYADALIQKQMLGSEDTNDIKEYKLAQSQGFKGGYQDWVSFTKGLGKPTYGVIGKDEFGRETYGWMDPTTRKVMPAPQMAAGGQGGSGAPTGPGTPPAAPVPASGPPGAVTPPVSAGITAPPPGVDPKVWREKQTETLAKAQSDLPRIIQNSTNALGLIDSLANHPGRSMSTGMLGVIPGIPGTQQRDFVSMHDQLKGKVFLEAFETLKGGGQITEVEGSKATQAIARLDRAQTDEAYGAALNDLKSVIKAGLRRSRIAAGQAAGDEPVAAPAAAPAGKTGPQPGTVEQGYRFKGGNPSKAENWEPVA